MVAAALIDRLVHHAHIATLRGKSYRLRERGTAPRPRVRCRVTDESQGFRRGGASVFGVELATDAVGRLVLAVAAQSVIVWR